MNRATITGWLVAAVGLAYCGCLAGCSIQPSGAATTVLSAAEAAARYNTPGQPPIVPDPRLTPGAVLPVTAQDVCRAGYARAVRDVPIAVKRRAYEEYGIAYEGPGHYEVDHLISLELGGSNSIRNLWPESYETEPWNARVKDQLENQLHDEVCSQQIDLPTAQHEIASDWIDAYKQAFHTQTPLSEGEYQSRFGSHWRDYEYGPSNRYAGGRRSWRTRERPSARPAPAAPGDVWVNTRSGKYFRQGSRYYGATREGTYMSESQAQAQGYVAAK